MQVRGPALMAAALAASPFAFAAETATGTVKSFGMNAHTLTFEPAISDQLPANFKDPGLKNGESWQPGDPPTFVDEPFERLLAR